MPDRFPLAVLPTPLQFLERLSACLGAEVWIKRDDLTGFAMGGNKVRKAERLIADALTLRAEVVLTAGAAQSNHARVIAAAARCAGMDAELFLSGGAPDAGTGNLVLDALSGARLHFVGDSAGRPGAMEARARELEREGRRAYIVPIGGSNALGARAYADAAAELAGQLRSLPARPTRVLFATSSGGTYAGLLAGVAVCGAPLTLLGIRVDDDPGHPEAIAAVAAEVARAMGSAAAFDPADVALESRWVGAGYGIPSAAGNAAIERLWRTEGILLDPVYSGKAMAGLIAMAEAGAFTGQRVVFVHTGGEPSVFA